METEPLIPKPQRKSLWSWMKCFVCPCLMKKKKFIQRVINLGHIPGDVFPPNIITNQKYTVVTFIPVVLFQQFRFFLNFFYLIMALSQFIPDLRIGFWYTYWGPLIFVLGVTVFREAFDDISRFWRDRCINLEKYKRLILDGDNKGLVENVPSCKLRVGDILLLQHGQRVPADVILLKASDRTGSVFVSTDQLDGETDWKVRVAVPFSQNTSSDSDLLDLNVVVFAEQPCSDIHEFAGTWNSYDAMKLEIEHTIWAGSVLQSSHATGLIIYTGEETRSVMNNSMPRSKVGQFDYKVNDMTKVLFGGVLMLSFLMIWMKGLSGPWFIYFFRFVLLFSYIIPISLRVNLELGKTFYAVSIKRDKEIEGTVMRSTTISEELGRVSYLLTDKTGTITKNEMAFQKFCLSDTCFGENDFHEVETLLTQHITKEGSSIPATPTESNESTDAFSPTSRVNGRQIWESILGIALCHNVTPVYVEDETDPSSPMNDEDTCSSMVSESRGGAIPQQQLCDYQAASPDEVALVKWTDFMGVSLYRRDLTSISLKLRVMNEIVNYNILDVFPFTSEAKCMGIIVQDIDTCEITFYLKGADAVLNPLVGPPSWLQRQSDSLASEGLRTLVFAKKRLSVEEYEAFKEEYKSALNSENRTEKIKECIKSLHRNLQLLCITGVEDRLADDAVMTIDMLRRAGIKIWMVTGDKLETALCISKSLHLVHAREHDAFIFQKCTLRSDIHAELLRLRAEGKDSTLVIDGESLESCLKWSRDEFAYLANRCESVVVARCTPTQKAYMVRLLQKFSKGSVCAVGDGGNDVPMIQEADIGIGLEGKEGRAAALASDVSAREFKNLTRLLLVHGRRSRLRSSTLSFFVIHRGLIISTMQAIFSTVFYLSSVSLYQGILMVGYGTLYTTLPVLSLVLDKDISDERAMRHPYLYRLLVRQRVFSYKMFFVWVALSIYQGAIIMYGALIVFDDEFIHIVSISFTALILTELIMVGVTINTCHWLIWMAEGISFATYLLSLIIFHEYFDTDFIFTLDFLWKVLLITVTSCFPIFILKYLLKKLKVRRRYVPINSSNSSC